MEYPDNELTFYLHDNNEDAIDIIYDKYKYIIDVLLNKYKRVFYALNIDLEEVKQEANLAFSYSIYSYDENKDASLNTFITLCVDRKIKAIIKKYETTKSKVFSDSISFDNTSNSISLENIIGDETYEPLKTLENIDTIKFINNEVKSLLSKGELEVYNLMVQGINYKEIAKKLNKTPKQIDNTIQRIRVKLKDLR